jgi:hypothetical protein
MGAITAVILIGQPHPNRGGNRAFAQIHLEEGGRPALVLQWLCPPISRGKESFRRFTMIPSLENTLDDSILMVAYAVSRHSAVFDKINRLTRNAPVESHRLTMYEDLTPAGRKSIYAALRKLDDLPKVTWCLFEGSLLNSSIAHLTKYKLECEVTRSVFAREYSAWTPGWDVRGGLS